MARAKQLEQQPGLTSANRFELAKAYAQAAQAAHQDKHLSAVDQERQAEQYTVADVELLAQAGQDGYFKDAASVARLRTDADLKPLHQRPEYQKFLTRLENSLR